MLLKLKQCRIKLIHQTLQNIMKFVFAKTQLEIAIEDLAWVIGNWVITNSDRLCLHDSSWGSSKLSILMNLLQMVFNEIG